MSAKLILEMNKDDDSRENECLLSPLDFHLNLKLKKE